MSVATGQTPSVQWKDTQLQGRATATGNTDSPNTAELRLTIDKNSVQCPADFKMYRCRLSAFSNGASEGITQETSPIALSYVGK